MKRLIRAILRMLARNMLFPKLRMYLLKLSGIEIGNNSFVNMNVTFIDNYRKNAIKLGDRVAIAPGVSFVADSDVNFSKLNKIESFRIRGEIIVGDDAWIGTNAIILPNIKVGKCAVIGAGAVVTKDVEDYSIVGGNPAKKLGDVRERLSNFTEL